MEVTEEEKDALYKDLTLLRNEYEKIFVSMRKQICSYKVQIQELQKKAEELILENKTLSKSLENALQIQSNYPKNEYDIFVEDVVDNLRNQLCITSQEKDITYELWQNSLKIIDHLELELKIYKGDKEEFTCREALEKAKFKHESEIKQLQKKLESTKSQQDQRIKNCECQANESQIALEARKTILSQVNRKNNEISTLKEKLNEVLGTCDQLKEEIRKRDEIIEKLSTIDKDSKAKVLESIVLVEAALAERDTMSIKEKEAKEEIRGLSVTMSNLIQEADHKISEEKEIIKKQYNENLIKVVNDMKAIQKTLDERERQMEAIIGENKQLKENISKLREEQMINDGNSNLLIFKRELESTSQKLLLSERRSLQMLSERNRIQADLDLVTELYERGRRNQELDRKGFERKIETLQNELSVSKSYVEEYATQFKELNTRIVQMEQNMNDETIQNENLLEKILAEKMNIAKNKNIFLDNELEKYLRKEHGLNKRWRKETKYIIDKLEKKIREYKRVNNKLRTKIQQLKSDSNQL